MLGYDNEISSVKYREYNGLLNEIKFWYVYTVVVDIRPFALR